MLKGFSLNSLVLIKLIRNSRFAIEILIVWMDICER